MKVGPAGPRTITTMTDQWITLRITLDEAKTLAEALDLSGNESQGYDALTAHQLNKVITALDPDWDPPHVPEHRPGDLGCFYRPEYLAQLAARRAAER